MDDTPIRANLDFPSKRKYGNIESSWPENCKGMFKEVQSDADADYVRFVKRHMMYILTDDNCEGVNDDAVGNDTRSEPINPNPFGDQESFAGELDTSSMYVSDIQCKIDMQSGSGKECKSKILKKSRKLAEGGKSEAAVNVKKDDEYDDEYQIYCNNLSCEGNNLVLKYQDKPPILYDAEDKLGNIQTNNSTNSMKRNAKLFAHLRGSHANVEEDDDCHYLGSLSRGRHSQFREQLMKILRKPYDIDEHKRLAQEIMARKPVKRHIELHHGTEKCYSSYNKDGKSYLDHYYDLKRKLLSAIAAEDSHKELNLLRGFFFWIQNLTREGAFKPWLDASCLAP